MKNFLFLVIGVLLLASCNKEEAYNTPDDIATKAQNSATSVGYKINMFEPASGIIASPYRPMMQVTLLDSRSREIAPAKSYLYTSANTYTFSVDQNISFPVTMLVSFSGHDTTKESFNILSVDPNFRVTPGRNSFKIEAFSGYDDTNDFVFNIALEKKVKIGF